MEKDYMIGNATKRSILRWIHIIFSFPILGYIHGPAEEVQRYAPLFGLSSFL